MASILAVDDSPSMRKLVASTLTSAGHQVLEAEDGVAALRVAQGRSVQLVITDVNMPNMNGLELIGKLRGLATYKFTPILVLTTEMDPNKKQQAKASGATGWIVKPFDPDTLLATIRKVIG
ncbi:MAG: response regulator [bacterium]